MKKIRIKYIVLLPAITLILNSCTQIKNDEPPVLSQPDSTKLVEPDDDKEAQSVAEIPPELKEGTLSITIEDAVLLALENNRALHIEKLNPAIQRTFEEQERAWFEPAISAGISEKSVSV